MFECVPNVSEGRDPAVVEALAASLRSVRGAHLLDHSSDADHNRSVFTLVGGPGALRQALVALYDSALEHVDFSRHEGVHPCIGAVDVVPFVPLEGATMSDAVTAARQLGEEVARRHELPVWLYEEAAGHPARRDLARVRAEIRQGGPGRSRPAVGGWSPDFGPAGLHPTLGATVVGARGLLIAFNAVLETDDLRIARRIARSIRESNGGLPSLKAIGVALTGPARAQVSMNLTNFRQTSLARAYEAVNSVAGGLGTSIRETELVGLVPEAALEGTSPEALKLREFGPGRILEYHLRRLA